MKTAEIYLSSAVCGSLSGFSLYEILITINQYNFNALYASVFTFLGLVAANLIILLLKRRYRRLYISEKFRLWMILFIQINVFFGIGFGLGVGMLISWLLIFPYTLAFGYPFPERRGFSPIRTYSFEMLMIIITMGSVCFFPYWFFKSSILYLEKKIGSSDKKNIANL